MSYRVLRGLPCPRFCKRQSVSCCLKSRECPFLSKESVSPERLHLFSLFFSVLTFSNFGKEVCRSVVSRHDLEFPRWSAPCCGDTLPYSSSAMFFFLHGPGRRVRAVSTAGVFFTIGLSLLEWMIWPGISLLTFRTCIGAKGR